MSTGAPDDLDTADAALAALAGADEGEDMISARQDASNLLVSTGPDVLWTPKGGGKVAVAYSVVAHMDTSIRLSMSVRDNGNYDFQLNSRTTEIEGHHPGTLKGVVVPGYQSYSHVKVASDFYYSEGFATVAHRHEAWINHPDPGPTEPQKNKSPEQIRWKGRRRRREQCRTRRPRPRLRARRRLARAGAILRRQSMRARSKERRPLPSRPMLRGSASPEHAQLPR